MSSDEVFGDWQPGPLAGAVEVLRDWLPRFPPVPSVVVVEPTGTRGGAVIRLDANVLFDFDGAAVRPDALAMLERVATLLRALDSPPARINGHTDQAGSESYHLSLSQQRAYAVREDLVTAGAVDASLKSHGFGETPAPLRPEVQADGDDDPAARQLNRRVEIVLLED